MPGGAAVQPFGDPRPGSASTSSPVSGHSAAAGVGNATSATQPSCTADTARA
ncbi:hypothetical protein ACO2Q3_22710 [Caulobacter sp. KR2-114]|uniref:hypothetical protein n=1 Tax=Caulobacter sp. KR2-114 TaxID=3400912 RepID=UPI003C07ADDB